MNNLVLIAILPMQNMKQATGHPQVWHDVLDCIQNGKLELFVRKPEVTEQYRKHKENLKGTSLDDFILKQLNWNADELVKLNREDYATDESKLERCFQSRELYQVMKNDFPYDFDSNIYHLVLWSKIRLPLYNETLTAQVDSHGNNIPVMNRATHDKIDAFLKYNLCDRLGVSGDNYCWFINYSSLQSIKSISHLHLLLRIDNKESKEYHALQLLLANDPNALHPLPHKTDSLS